MADGDKLHVIIKDLVGTLPDIELYDEDGNVEDSYPIVINYGALYNWYAVNDTRGLAPMGTHIPNNDEFQELIDCLGVGGGGKLKAIDESWLAPNTGASNDSGFTALCSNFRYDYGEFAGDVDQEGMITYFYSTELNGDAPYFLFLSYDSDEAVILFADYGGDDLKNNAASIRCLLDDPESWEEGDTITDKDGNVYNTVKIGEQVWLKQNLVVTKYRNGDSIPIVEDETTWAELTSPAMCYYNNDETYA